MPAAVLQPSGRSYIAPDHLGSPHQITDANGAVVWLWHPDPFGNGDPTGSFAYELRFPGQYFDQATRLHYNYFRDYDPRTGRYLESDPIGLAGGTNTYAYVGSNPLTDIDPDSLKLGLKQCLFLLQCLLGGDPSAPYFAPKPTSPPPPPPPIVQPTKPKQDQCP